MRPSDTIQFRPRMEPLEDRILLSHKTGHNPGGGGGSGGGDTTPAQYELINLGTLGGLVSEAADVNSAGMVVGYAHSTTNSVAFVVPPEDTNGDGVADLWFRDDNGDGANDLMIELTTTPDTSFSEAHGINASGQVVGFYRIPGLPLQGFLITPEEIDGELSWNADDNGDGVNDLMTVLGSLGGGSSFAKDINDGGQVVGWARAVDGNDYPFLWNPDAPNGDAGTMIHLGTLGGAAPHPGSGLGAYSINNAGQVAGITMIVDPDSWYGGRLRGFLITPQDIDSDGTLEWRDDDVNGNNILMTDLGSLEDDNRSKAYAVNDDGLVVGEAGSTISPIYGHAVRWDQQTDGSYGISELGGLHGGRYHSRAEAVNADGVIVGFSQEMKLTFIQAGGIKGYEPIGEERAFVVAGGRMEPLDELVSNLAGLDTVNAALAISDAGLIAGWGEVDGNRSAFLAVPAALLTANSSSSLSAETTSASQQLADQQAWEAMLFALSSLTDEER